MSRITDRAQETIERSFNAKKRSVHKSQCKKVLYDGNIYESGRALARHLKMSHASSIYQGIKKGTLNGKSIGYYKEPRYGKNSNRN